MSRAGAPRVVGAVARRARDRGLPHGRPLHGRGRRSARSRTAARPCSSPTTPSSPGSRSRCSGSPATSRSSPRSSRDGEAWRTATAFLALAGLRFSAWLTYVEIVRHRGDLHLVRRLGGVHDGARGALGRARAQRAAARPAGVSVKTAGADAPQIPSGPQSASAERVHEPARDGLVDRPGQRVAGRAAEPRVSASSVAGPPRSARRMSSATHTSSVTNRGRARGVVGACARLARLAARPARRDRARRVRRRRRGRRPRRRATPPSCRSR